MKDMQHYTITSFALLFLAAAVSMVGCGDGKLRTEPVRGVVTLDGVPLEGASVSFIPKNEGEGIASFGLTDANGEYRLQTLAGRVDAGTLPGEYTVTISKFRAVPTGRMRACENSGELYEDTDSVIYFPGMEKYASSRTTPFSATVVKGRNTFDFDMSSVQ